MYIYEFYWSWYEDYQPTLFSSLEEKSIEQWQEDCKKALREVGEKYLKEEDGWASAPHWIKKAGEVLVKYGYKEVSPISFGHFGSYIINHEEDDNYHDEEGGRWKELVGEDLYNKAVEHNRKLDSTLWSDKVKDIKKESDEKT